MEEAKAYKEKIFIETYQLKDDDLNPMLNSRLNPYPYTLQNNRSYIKENIEYEAIILENSFLKLTVLPELGGRLYSAFDKINNREMFYKNKVIKPRMIGTRGAWISGGVEFNFPISHSPTTMDKVNCYYEEYEEGSAEIIFGNIELMSKMSWRVKLKLYKDKAFIEETVTIDNPTQNKNRFYFWTNAAVDYTESTELIYPFDWCINNLEDKYIKWPSYKGYDCTYAKNVPFAYETFGKLMIDNFFSAYSHEDEYGVVHYADRKDVKGCKFFIWGNDDMANAWNKALTDDDSQYIEIQSGPFETQMVYKFLRPQQEISWKEYWYPISNINGLKYAEKEIALNYSINTEGITMYIYPVTEMKGSQIILTIDGIRDLKSVDLIVGLPNIVEFSFDTKKDSKLMLDIYHGNRHILNMGQRDEYTDESLDVDIYEDSRIIRGEEDNEKTLKTATIVESLGQESQALELYHKNLEKYPHCTTTLNSLGRIYLKRNMLNEAKGYFERVLHYDNRNSEARFYLACCFLADEKIFNARRLFQDISADAEYYYASKVELIKINIKLGFLKDAQNYIEALSNRRSTYLSFLSSLAYRRDGLTQTANHTLRLQTVKDEYLLCEQYLLDQSQVHIEKLLKVDEKIFTQCALEYIKLGAYDDAKRLLLIIENPSIISKLLIKYVSDALQEAYSLDFALDAKLDYAFINDVDLYNILLKYIDEDMSGKIDYLVGVYLDSVGRKEDAYNLYKEAYRKGLRYTVLLVNLGKYDNQESVKAKAFFEEDLMVNNGINESSMIALSKIYREEKDFERLGNLMEYFYKANNRSLLLIEQVEALCELKRFEEAENILEKEEFENWEGLEASGACYRQAIFKMAVNEIESNNLIKAKAYLNKLDNCPSNLNYGDSIRMPLCELYFYKGKILYMCGELNEAKEMFEKGIAELSKDFAFTNKKISKFGELCKEELEKLECK